MLRELHRVATPRRNLPHRGVVSVFSVDKVDPLAIMRPARQVVSPNIDIELPGYAAVWIDEVDVGFTPSPRVECDQLAIGRPARCAGSKCTEGAELHRIRAVSIGDPDFIVAAGAV